MNIHLDQSEKCPYCKQETFGTCKCGAQLVQHPLTKELGWIRVINK